MYKLFSVLLLCVLSGCSAKAAVCEQNVCQALYASATSSLSLSYLESMALSLESKGVKPYMDAMGKAYKTHKESVQADYQKALKLAEGNAPATAAIKDLYVKWMSAMNYLSQAAVLDRESVKNMKHQQNTKEFDDAWVRLQVEAGI